MSNGNDWMGDALPDPTAPGAADDPAWVAFRSQFASYSRAARENRLAYQVTRVLTLVLAAAVTVSAGVAAPPLLTAGIGAGIVVLEGLQQLFQWHENWISYRQATETMRQSAIDFVTGTGAYAAPDPEARLALLSDVRREVAVTEGQSWAGRMAKEPDHG